MSTETVDPHVALAAELARLGWQPEVALFADAFTGTKELMVMASQPGRGIGIDVSAQTRLRVAFRPDQPLQRLERRRLAVFGDPRVQVREHA